MFRYDRRLCKIEEARKVVTDAWQDVLVASVTEKLASARSAISLWNRTQQRNSMKIIQHKKKELNAALSSPTEDSALIQEISTQLNVAYAAEEEFWRQRSRLLWLKLGDRSTGFSMRLLKLGKGETLSL